MYIQHGRNVGERRVEPYFLDGCCEETRTAYELSWRHVQPGQRFDHARTVQKNASQNDVLETTRLASGGNVGMCVSRFTSTGCGGQNGLKDIVDPLNPRDAFYGGRVNAVKLLVKTEANPTTKIKYVDFTSLYPDINKNGVYPVGHPIIFTENIHPDITGYFGLIQCDVLAPRGLYHPVLPFKCHNKLMFALCRTCAQECQQISMCHHTDEKRIFTGTWVSLELNLAVEMGYKVVKIHGVWHFPDKTERLFRGYIDMFLKKLPGGLGGVKRPKTKRSTFKSTKRKKGSSLIAMPLNTMPVPERCGSRF